MTPSARDRRTAPAKAAANGKTPPRDKAAGKTATKVATAPMRPQPPAPNGSGAPPPPETSLAELVSSAAKRDPTGIAAAVGRHRITYDQLDRAVAALSNDLLDRGIQPGHSIGLMAETGIEFIVLAHAVLRTGAVLVPISPSAPPAEVSGQLRAARVEMVLADVDHEAVAWASAAAYDNRCGALTADIDAKRHRGDRLSLPLLMAANSPPPPPRLKPGSPAVLLFTSGSTARPKGVLHSHEGLFRNALAVAWEMTNLTSRDVMLGPVPLAHSYGLSAVMNASILAGTRLELMPRFETKAAWRIIRNRGVTVITGVPTMYRRLADDPDASRNTDLRLAVVSGAACPRSVARDIRLRMGVHAVERYGMTEASPLTWRVVVDDAPDGDVGWPGWGVHFRATKNGRTLPPGREGELEVRSPSMLLRYTNAEDNRAGFNDGWLRTGDLGMVRPDGGITLQGRLKDVVLRGGYSVAPGEVEKAILAHPLVADAVVVGIPDSNLGEELAAALVLKPRRHAMPEWEVVMEMERHMKDKLATWKRPRLWRVIDKVPRTPLGKVKRDQLVHLWDHS